MALRRRGARQRGTSCSPASPTSHEIGVGSLAVVFRAPRDRARNRLVALKLLNVRDASPRVDRVLRARVDRARRAELAPEHRHAVPHVPDAGRTARARARAVHRRGRRPAARRRRAAGARGGRRSASRSPARSRPRTAAASCTATSSRRTSWSPSSASRRWPTSAWRCCSRRPRRPPGCSTSPPCTPRPELLEGGGTSAATDVYELASSLYQLIAGQSAFRAYEGESPASVILRILRDPVRPLSGVGRADGAVGPADPRDVEEEGRAAADRGRVRRRAGRRRDRRRAGTAPSSSSAIPGRWARASAPTVTRMPDAVPRGLPSTLAPSQPMHPRNSSDCASQLAARHLPPLGAEPAPSRSPTSPSRGRTRRRPATEPHPARAAAAGAPAGRRRRRDARCRAVRRARPPHRRAVGPAGADAAPTQYQPPDCGTLAPPCRCPPPPGRSPQPPSPSPRPPTDPIRRRRVRAACRSTSTTTTSRPAPARPTRPAGAAAGADRPPTPGAGAGLGGARADAGDAAAPGGAAVQSRPVPRPDVAAPEDDAARRRVGGDRRRAALQLRTWFKRSKIAWTDVQGFEAQLETVDDGATTAGRHRPARRADRARPGRDARAPAARGRAALRPRPARRLPDPGARRLANG